MPKEFHNGSKLNKKLIAPSISLTPKGAKSRTLQAVKFGGLCLCIALKVLVNRMEEVMPISPKVLSMTRQILDGILVAKKEF